MRFQDAAPDARAIVYAGVQRDPLVARLAELLGRATPPQSVLARAVMNGERADPIQYPWFGDPRTGGVAIGESGSGPPSPDARLLIAHEGERSLRDGEFRCDHVPERARPDGS